MLLGPFLSISFPRVCLISCQLQDGEGDIFYNLATALLRLCFGESGPHGYLQLCLLLGLSRSRYLSADGIWLGSSPLYINFQPVFFRRFAFPSPTVRDTWCAQFQRLPRVLWLKSVSFSLRASEERELELKSAPVHMPSLSQNVAHICPLLQ